MFSRRKQRPYDWAAAADFATGLTKIQATALNSFLDEYLMKPPPTEVVAEMDQAVAELRDNAEVYEINWRSPQMYFAFATGLSMAADIMSKYVEAGYDPASARDILRIQVAGLAPREADRS